MSDADFEFDEVIENQEIEESNNKPLDNCQVLNSNKKIESETKLSPKKSETNISVKDKSLSSNKDEEKIEEAQDLEFEFEDLTVDMNHNSEIKEETKKNEDISNGEIVNGPNELAVVEDYIINDLMNKGTNLNNVILENTENNENKIIENSQQLFDNEIQEDKLINKEQENIIQTESEIKQIYQSTEATLFKKLNQNENYQEDQKEINSNAKIELEAYKEAQSNDNNNLLEGNNIDKTNDIEEETKEETIYNDNYLINKFINEVFEETYLKLSKQNTYFQDNNEKMISSEYLNIKEEEIKSHKSSIKEETTKSNNIDISESKKLIIEQDQDDNFDFEEVAEEEVPQNHQEQIKTQTESKINQEDEDNFDFEEVDEIEQVQEKPIVINNKDDDFEFNEIEEENEKPTKKEIEINKLNLPNKNLRESISLNFISKYSKYSNNGKLTNLNNTLNINFKIENEDHQDKEVASNSFSIGSILDNYYKIVNEKNKVEVKLEAFDYDKLKSLIPKKKDFKKLPKDLLTSINNTSIKHFYYSYLDSRKDYFNKLSYLNPSSQIEKEEDENEEVFNQIEEEENIVNEEEMKVSSVIRSKNNYKSNKSNSSVRKDKIVIDEGLLSIINPQIQHSKSSNQEEIMNTVNIDKLEELSEKQKEDDFFEMFKSIGILKKEVDVGNNIDDEKEKIVSELKQIILKMPNLNFVNNKRLEYPDSFWG